MAYDIELRSSGDGWMGTFSIIVQAAVADILSDGEPWPDTEVTLDDGTVVAGSLGAWGDTFTITEPGGLPRIIEIDDVRRFRA